MIVTELFTDYHLLQESYALWKAGRGRDDAFFYLSFRRPPCGTGFGVAAGIDEAMQLLDAAATEGFFGADLRDRLLTSSPELADPAFLSFLEDAARRMEVHAVRDGTLVFPQAPLLRLQAPLALGLVLEPLLDMYIGHGTQVASRAARLVCSAGKAQVVEFALRRSASPEAALLTSRAAAVAGCRATTNLQAAARYGLALRRPMSHNWVLAHATELEAFEAAAEANSEGLELVLDTYDAAQGLRAALPILSRLKKAGQRPLGVRLDSGDLLELSRLCRAQLEEAGLGELQIAAGGGLDEKSIEKLSEHKAPIDVFYVGSAFAATEQPNAGVSSKICAWKNGHSWETCAKFGEDVTRGSLPGVLSLSRFSQGHRFVGDVIFSELLYGGGNAIMDDRTFMPRILHGTHESLLRRSFAKGRRLFPAASVADDQAYCAKQLAGLPPAARAIQFPEHYTCGVDPEVHQSKVELQKRHIRR